MQSIGIIIDSVLVANSPNETFAVYLPKNYDPKTPASIVFIFEPGARGKVGIEPFVLASETYSYILVCSNNCKNGPIKTNKEIAGRLFDFVFTQYFIDHKRMYVAGFSGGSRFASNTAMTTGAFAGIIACGASFNSFDKVLPPANRFSYAGLVGDSDMNFQEMVGNKSWLTRININNELFVSEDKHVWPSQEQVLRAFDWLEIQAYRKNLKRNDQSVIGRIYQKNVTIADSLMSSKNAISAVKEYERIINNFDKALVQKAVRKNMIELKESKIYKQQIKNEQEIFDLENKLEEEFLVKFNSDLKNIKKGVDYKSWKNEIDKLDKIDVKSNDKALSKMKYRLQSTLWGMIYEASAEFKETKQNDKY
ncbi:hypothetical protein LZZ90_13500 [Flavobacterium sp. SM15]|uniref:hypothetical protein n=1 Tax=Flavobacterium sp. SM15 TaxID=2908005 RepID=UPI001EDC6283|nr:hypothetical protein [Flavobacterium sp. SM15]MCG2612525.1 hypothetical protein [Flavobacterium sp. SM15]